MVMSNYDQQLLCSFVVGSCGLIQVNREYGGVQAAEMVNPGWHCISHSLLAYFQIIQVQKDPGKNRPQSITNGVCSSQLSIA